jgi:hypothetical protein
VTPTPLAVDSTAQRNGYCSTSPQTRPAEVARYLAQLRRDLGADEVMGPRERPKEGTTPAVKRPASVAGSHPQPRLFGAGLPSRARDQATPTSLGPKGLCALGGRADLRTTVALRPGARHNLDRIGRTLGYLESRGRAARAGVDSEPTGQSPSGLEVGRSWNHLKRCKWVLGSTSTMSLRPTDGCPSAGAAVLGLMVRRGFTSRTKDNWSVRCDGLMRSR